ncbi:phosphohistidine phosphatase SixA [Pseudomonas sp. NPDC078700]|uniref:phosphohistidine phosphatase SixA n=1 Tax=Pseudomonas sp. NPDC078700 TaxID=3364424 RepID=UPI0037CB4D0A
MRLWLLRHGEAQPSAASDAVRPLTAHGQDQVRKAALQLEGRPIRQIIASPYLRTQQTAALVAEVLGYKSPIITAPWLTPDSQSRNVIRQLDVFADEEVLLVTHQPLVGDLVGLLVHGHREQPLPMMTASLAELDGPMVAAGAMDLLAVVHAHH